MELIVKIGLCAKHCVGWGELLSLISPSSSAGNEVTMCLKISPTWSHQALSSHFRRIPTFSDAFRRFRRKSSTAPAALKQQMGSKKHCHRHAYSSCPKHTRKCSSMGCLDAASVGRAHTSRHTHWHLDWQQAIVLAKFTIDELGSRGHVAEILAFVRCKMPRSWQLQSGMATLPKRTHAQKT